MTPEKLTDTVTLYEADALDVLPLLEPGSVDAVITDPPYSSGGAFRSDKNRDTATKYIGGGYAPGSTALLRQSFGGDNRDQRAYLRWATMWLSDAFGLTKPGGVCVVFTDWRQLPVTTDALQCGEWVWRGLCPWDKTEAARPQKGWFRNQCEYAVWGSKGAMPEGGDCHPGLHRQSVLSEGKEHIAGKPVGLMRWLVRIAPPGGTVLDPFAGSGSTAVAAVLEGRRCILIEKDPGHCDTIRRRIDEVYQRTPGSLFAEATP